MHTFTLLSASVPWCQPTLSFLTYILACLHVTHREAQRLQQAVHARNMAYCKKKGYIDGKPGVEVAMVSSFAALKV